jgi:glycosyltransferase involved in cell wall biosynthesis
MAKIAIDASRSTVARSTGTEHYSHQLIRHLIQFNEQRENPHELILYFRDEPAPELLPAAEHVTVRVIPFPRMWTHIRFAAALWTEKHDLVFVPAHTLPFWFPGKAVVTVHDLGYKHFPAAHPASQLRYLDWSTRYSAGRAARIFADSKATASDLMQFYGVPESRIDVIYPGVEAPREGIDHGLRAKYNLPVQYFLFIGTLQPRKNIARIVEAYAIWRRANPESSIGLVLAGQKGWLFDPAWVEGVEGVTVTGYIDEADKAGLMRQAHTLVFPSLYEGFGFPVIEAMYARTPVIASQTSSLPELVGDAGLLVNPLDVNEIATALDLLTRRDDLRHNLIHKGLQQARRFSWAATAQHALRVFDAVLQSPE